MTADFASAATTPETLLADLLAGAAAEAPFILATAIIVWLSLPQLAERFAVIGKLLRPLSKRWREKAAKLDAQRDAVAMEQAKKLAAAAMKEMTPPDVRKMEDRLAHVEDAEDMLRAFVIYDELWHFHDDHNEARRGRKPALRLAFDTFEEKWQKGWRPFDEQGRYTGDYGDDRLPRDDRALNTYQAPDE